MKEKTVFKDGICPRCGGMTHGTNDGPMICGHCEWTSKSRTHFDAITEMLVLEILYHRLEPGKTLETTLTAVYTACQGKGRIGGLRLGV